MTARTMIDSSWTVNEAIATYPETITVFNSFGIDMCCGADETIAVAAEDSNVDRDTLMSAVLDVAAGSKALR